MTTSNRSSASARAASSWASATPERHLQAGVEWADSYTTDAHKWLLTGFDATLFWVADRAALTGALSILPEYLRNAATDAGTVVDFRDWQIPLGRRFRALKLWFVLRWYGAEGLRDHISSSVGLAQEFAAWVEAEPGWEVVAPHPFSTVCFRHTEADNDAIARAATATGELFVATTKLRGRTIIRLAIGNERTTEDDIRRSWEVLRSSAL